MWGKKLLFAAFGLVTCSNYNQNSNVLVSIKENIDWHKNQIDKVVSNFYVLGDSLSDTGAWVGGLSAYNNAYGKMSYHMDGNYYKSRSWTNGKVAVELVAEKLNLKFEPGWWFTLNLPDKQHPKKIKSKVFSKIGNNYAVGGEKIITTGLPIDKAFNLKSQANMLLKQHKLQSQDLIFIEIGANDLASLCRDTKLSDLPIIQKKITKILNNLRNVIILLIENGAKKIMVTDVPDLTLTPDIKEALNHDRAKLKFASQTCLLYQTQWKNMIMGMQHQYRNVIKPFYLSNSLKQNMKIFQEQVHGGVVDTSAGYAVFVFDTNTLCWKPNDDITKADIYKYFYFDKFHPSSFFHQHLAAEIFASIPEFMLSFPEINY